MQLVFILLALTGRNYADYVLEGKAKTSVVSCSQFDLFGRLKGCICAVHTNEFFQQNKWIECRGPNTYHVLAEKLISQRRVSRYHWIYIHDDAYLTKLRREDFSRFTLLPDKLYFTGCRILDIHEGLLGRGWKTTSVYEIHLQNNLLSSIRTNQFGEVPNLETINLERNRISFISKKAFEHHRKLKNLYLGHNKLQLISPGMLHGLGQLYVLSAEHNEIKEVENNFLRNSPLVEQIYLQYNKICFLEKDVFDEWGPFNKSLGIDLSYNRIQYIEPGIFRSMNQEVLQIYEQIDNRTYDDVTLTVNLANNKLSTFDICWFHDEYTTLNETTHENFTHILMDISDNSLECNCNLTFLRYTNTSIEWRAPLCAQPQSYSIFNFPENTCGDLRVNQADTQTGGGGSSFGSSMLGGSGGFNMGSSSPKDIDPLEALIGRDCGDYTVMPNLRQLCVEKKPEQVNVVNVTCNETESKPENRTIFCRSCEEKCIRTTTTSTSTTTSTTTTTAPLTFPTEKQEEPDLGKFCFNRTYLYLAAAVVGILVIIIVALIVCLCKQCSGRKIGPMRQEADAYAMGEEEDEAEYNYNYEMRTDFELQK